MKFKDTKYGDLTGQVYNGDIYIIKKGLTSLEGCPKEVVKGSLWVQDNKITKLDFFPEKVDVVVVANNPLESLKGLPDSVRKLNCTNIDIKDLVGIPSNINTNFDGYDNRLLESLYTGKPTIKVGHSFNIQKCPKLKNVKQQIIENQIKANFYDTDEGNFPFEEIEKEFNAFVPLTGKIQSKGFRTLLGLNK